MHHHSGRIIGKLGIRKRSGRAGDHPLLEQITEGFYHHLCPTCADTGKRRPFHRCPTYTLHRTTTYQQWYVQQPISQPCLPFVAESHARKNHSRNYLLTIDKISTWNQGPIAQSFGMDTIIAYHDFELTEAFGTHKRTGDGSFFAQCQEKIEKGEIWKEGENAYMQLITYSGHAPFILPEYLREISFSSDIPEKMGNYMITARYTDKAIGKFVEYLKTLPQYKETLIVITGDHEGLASYRAELCESPGGKGIVSDKQFTPFIVVNSPIGMRYDEVMGQIDMYPTLLNLLQLDDYYWTGLGESILNPEKKGFAVGSQMNVEGEGYSPEDEDFAKEAYDISDEMIRFNYFGKK